jgi:hypothetical protein
MKQIQPEISLEEYSSMPVRSDYFTRSQVHHSPQRLGSLDHPQDISFLDGLWYYDAEREGEELREDSVLGAGETWMKDYESDDTLKYESDDTLIYEGEGDVGTQMLENPVKKYSVCYLFSLYMTSADNLPAAHPSHHHSRHLPPRNPSPPPLRSRILPRRTHHLHTPDTISGPPKRTTRTRIAIPRTRALSALPPSLNKLRPPPYPSISIPHTRHPAPDPPHNRRCPLLQTLNILPPRYRPCRLPTKAGKSTQSLHLPFLPTSAFLFRILGRLELSPAPVVLALDQYLVPPIDAIPVPICHSIHLRYPRNGHRRVGE